MIKSLDKESRLTLLRQASPEVQELYGGEENGRIISALAEKLGIISDDAYDTFALTVGDIILGSYAKDVLGQLLKDRMEFTDEQVKITEDALQDFLNKLPQTKTTATKESVILVPPPEATMAPNQAVSSDNQPDAVQNKIGLKPLRTFADDVAMSRAHTYGAFRSADDNDGDDDTPTYHSNQNDLLDRR